MQCRSIRQKTIIQNRYPLVALRARHIQKVIITSRHLSVSANCQHEVKVSVICLLLLISLLITHCVILIDFCLMIYEGNNCDQFSPLAPQQHWNIVTLFETLTLFTKLSNLILLIQCSNVSLAPLDKIQFVSVRTRQWRKSFYWCHYGTNNGDSMEQQKVWDKLNERQSVIC